MKRKKLSFRFPNLKSIKLLRFVLLVFIIILGLFFTLREINFPQINIPRPVIKNSEITKREVLQKINELRVKNKLQPFKENQKLTNASLIRVEALSIFKDWGEKAATGSGVSRDNAALAVGLNYQAIGSLEYGFYSNETIEDAIKFWSKEKASKETILAGDLKEIGIASKNTEIEGEKVQLLVIILIDPVTQSNSETKAQTPLKPSGNLSWTGPQLFEEVNASRKRHGVNGLGLNDDLCSIASARVHQLLQRGYQDGHNGFQEMYSNKDSAYFRYFEKYNISEFLVFSNKGPEDAVKQWEATLTHRTLLTGGQYTIGCTSAFSGIGVAIAGY